MKKTAPMAAPTMIDVLRSQASVALDREEAAPPAGRISVSMLPQTVPRIHGAGRERVYETLI
ncbi:hypothetical protein [Streptomyces lutosisoli]|uniref:Uncharacterized protein n=1 Tax=Streptomyces lutosisoli TaxID=2665721 RepID=A0ABW2VMK2_9ACTN